MQAWQRFKQCGKGSHGTLTLLKWITTECCLTISSHLWQGKQRYLMTSFIDSQRTHAWATNGREELKETTYACTMKTLMICMSWWILCYRALTHIIGADGSWNYAKSNPDEKTRCQQKSCFICRDTPPEQSTLNGCVFSVTCHFSKLIARTESHGCALVL